MTDPIADSLGISQYNPPKKPGKKYDIRKSGNEKKRMMDGTDIKEKQIIDLRRKGYSFRQIADELSYSGPGAVHNAYRRVMERDWEALAESAQAHRIEQMEILDEQLRILLERQEVDPDNLNVTDRILKVLERRSKLLGLDMPTKIESNQKVSLTHESWLDMLADPDDGE